MRMLHEPDEIARGQSLFVYPYGLGFARFAEGLCWPGLNKTLQIAEATALAVKMAKPGEEAGRFDDVSHDGWGKRLGGSHIANF